MRPAAKLGVIDGLLLWLVLAVATAALLGSLNIPTFVKLVNHGTSARATIRQTNCDQHSSASYTFTVDTARYSGSDSMVRGCDTLRPGDQIPIYYDVTDPTLNRAVEPWAGLTNEIIAVMLGTLIFPTFIVGVIHFQTRWTTC